jgi:hypothetical protein
MAYTGGELNYLNGKYGISAPNKSVPVMKLIRKHQPKSPKELEEQIKYHFKNNCKCGIKSKGTIEDFGRNLYEAQIIEWGKYEYSLEECIEWEYNLFIINSLIGNQMERKAIKLFKEKLPHLEIRESSNKEDEDFRVDLVIKNNNKIICGIQVKPESFNYVRKSIIYFNKNANQHFSVNVYYLFYNNNLEFINLDEIVKNIKENK